MAAKYILARSAGFCFGVERSIRMAEEALDSGACRCLGELIHNRDAVSSLEKKGLSVIEKVSELPEGERVIIRAHGVSRVVYDELKNRRAGVIDATCPLVERIHKIVREESEKGRQIVVIGDAEHPEIRGICGWCTGAFYALFTAALDEWLSTSVEMPEKPLSVVFQTTQIQANHILAEKILKKRCTNFKIFDTICGATSKRQREATSLAGICDAMIVIGGAHSANSLHLAELCREKCASVFFVADASELDTSRLPGEGRIGITAGASVPSWIIKEVVKKMSDEIKVEQTTAEEVAATAAEETAHVEAEPAAENAAAENHIEHLERRSHRIDRENLPCHQLDGRADPVDLHIRPARQEHHGAEHGGSNSAVDHQTLRRLVSLVIVFAAEPLPNDHARRL